MIFSREAGRLKIATFNINNINKRLHNLVAWLARAQPDVGLPPGTQGRAASISSKRPS
jgi:exonuclease III